MDQFQNIAPNCALCGVQLVWREKGNYGPFWGHPAPRADGTWCKGKPVGQPVKAPAQPVIAPKRPLEAPPQQVMSASEQSALLVQLTLINERLDKIENMMADKALGIKEEPRFRD